MDVVRALPELGFCFLCIISALMCTRVACGTERDQVLFGVAAGMAAKLFVMDFQVRHRAARLTAPAVAAQHLLPETLVRHGSSRKRTRFG